MKELKFAAPHTGAHQPFRIFVIEARSPLENLVGAPHRRRPRLCRLPEPHVGGHQDMGRRWQRKFVGHEKQLEQQHHSHRVR